MTRGVVLAAGGGGASGLLWVSLPLLGPLAAVLAYFAPLPLLLVGLGLGVRSAGVASAVALALVAAGDGPRAAGGLLVFAAAPALMMSHLALRSIETPGGRTWYPLGLLLTWFAGLASALWIAAGLVALTRGGLEAFVTEETARALRALVAQPDAETARREATRAAGWLPAAIGAAWFMMQVVNAVLAQGVLVASGRNRRPRPVFTEIELPPGLMYALAGALVLSFLPARFGFFGTPLAVILAIPYFFLGLTIVHVVSRGWPLRGVALVALYVVTALGLWPAIAFVALGLLEPWLHLRRRQAGVA